MSRDALVVGINQYPYISHLKTPALDAEALAHILQHYGNFRVKRLPFTGQIDALQVDPKQSVTVAELKTAIAQLFNPQGDNIPDTALLYFAGHGLRETLGGISEGYLATSDASPRKNIWGVSLQWLRRLLQESPVRQQIVWLDCCHSGELLNFDEADPGNREGRDRCFIAASRDFEVAYGGGEHGVLTNALLQALDPKRHPEGRVTTKTLVASLKQALEAVPVPQRFRHDYSGNEIILTLDKKEKSTHLAFAGCPYKGLDYFKTEDHEYFYGRTALTDKLLEKVRSKNFLVVLGASGSGKSSLVRAGLLYQLQQGLKLSGSDRWQIYQPFTPGENPLQRLAEVMGKELQTPDGKFLLEQVIKDSSSDRIVLVVDQFEEVFTLCQDNSKRQQFFDCLLDTLEQTANKFCLVLVMRTDFLDKCLPYSRLATLLGDESTHAIVTPMTAKQLEEAIRVPASKVGLEIENALIKQILEDLGASNASGTIDGETEESAQKREPESLPLLEYTLEQLWLQPRTLDLLTLTSYQELGGVRGALRKQADAIFHELTPEEQLATRRIFVSLTQLGEGTEDTRRRVAQTDLVTAQLPAALIDRVVQKFAQKRLLVITSGSATGETEAETVSPLVEVAHEALIRHWPRLRGWLDENREMLRRQRRIDAEAKQWAENGKKPEYLLQGSRLGDAEEFLATYPEELSTLAVELVRESQRERDRLQKERDRQRRRTILGLTTGLVAVSIFATGAVWQWQRAERQRLISEADNLGNLALSQFQSGEGGINALMIAMEAGQKLKQLVKDGEPLANYPTTSPLLALQTITSNIREKNEFKSDSQGINKVIFTPDGKQIVSFSRVDSKIIIWNLAGQKVTEWKGPENKQISDLVISPDGKHIATVNQGGGLYIWDYSGKKIADVETSAVDQIIKFSPDSQYIAVASKWGVNVNLFDLSGNKVKELVTNGGGTLHSLEFTANGEELLTGNAVGLVQFWNLKNLQKTREFKAHTNQVVKIAVSPNGQQLLTLGVDVNSSKTGTIISRLWDLSGKKIADFSFSQAVSFDAGGDVGFSPDGKQIATVTFGEGAVKLYDAISGKLIDQFIISSFLGFSFSYSPDGQTIAIAGTGIKLFSKAKPDVTELPTDYKRETNQLKEASIINLRYSANGKKLVITDFYNHILDIWDWQQKKSQKVNLGQTLIDNGNLPIRLPNFASLTPDGKSIIIVFKESIQKVDLEGNLISEVKANVTSREIILHAFSSYAGGYIADKTYSSSFDGSKIVTNGYNLDTFKNRVHLWNLSSNQVKQLENDYIPKIIGQVVISPDGKYILIIASGRGKVWDNSGNLIAGLGDIKTKPSAKGIEFSMIGILLNSSNTDVLVFDKDKKEFLPYSYGIEIMEVLQNSTAMKAGLKSGDIILEIDGQKVSDLKGNKYEFLKGNPGTNVKIKIKTTNDKIEEKTIVREKFIYDENQFIFGNRGKFSPDSKYLASFDYPGGESIYLRNISSNKVVEINNKSKLLDIYFSPDSKLIAITDTNYSITIWDIYGRLITKIKLEKAPINLIFSPDSQQIGFLGHPNELSVWSIAGKQIAKYIIPEQGQAQIQFSPDGKYIATGRGKVFIWRNQNLNELLATGCDWLKEYLATRPEENQKLKVCQLNNNSK